MSKLEAWAVFCKLFLGDDRVHPTTYEMFLLLEETSGVSPRLRAQALPVTYFSHRPPSPDTSGVQQELPPGVGEAAEGVVAKLQYPEEGSRNSKFLSKVGRPPRGASTTRAPPPPTRSAPLPGIRNNPTGSRHHPNNPGA